LILSLILSLSLPSTLLNYLVDECLTRYDANKIRKERLYAALEKFLESEEPHGATHYEQATPSTPDTRTTTVGSSGSGPRTGEGKMMIASTSKMMNTHCKSDNKFWVRVSKPECKSWKDILEKKFGVYDKKRKVTKVSGAEKVVTVPTDVNETTTACSTDSDPSALTMLIPVVTGKKFGNFEETYAGTRGSLWELVEISV
jgi:hypothetical protein